MLVSNFRRKEAIPNHFILILFALLAVLPILVLFFNSIKPFSEFGLNPLGPPSEIRLQNFPDAWIAGEYTKIFLIKQNLFLDQSYYVWLFLC